MTSSRSITSEWFPPGLHEFPDSRRESGPHELRVRGRCERAMGVILAPDTMPMHDLERDVSEALSGGVENAASRVRRSRERQDRRQQRKGSLTTTELLR